MINLEVWEIKLWVVVHFYGALEVCDRLQGKCNRLHCVQAMDLIKVISTS